MGEVSETMTKRKKKGRPSLLDLQKRTLKKQQQHQQQQLQLQNPKLINSHSDLNRRPTRRNSVHAAEEGIADDDDDERKQKKHKLLVVRIRTALIGTRTITIPRIPARDARSMSPITDQMKRMERFRKRRTVNMVRRGSLASKKRFPRSVLRTCGSRRAS
ncbi:hypothetical protein K1719_044628 [Acacia pycnantha]|nr:hypothetical protein K1719_044628 [Acacia pycnantha]